MEYSAAVLKVAVTIEQSWHRVPGGTARAAIGLLDELKGRVDTEIVAVAAYHRSPPPDEWAVGVPVRMMPLPRRLLYETWHAPRVQFPRIETITGPIDVVHATGVVYPATRCPVVYTVHDLAFVQDRRLVTRHGWRFFHRGLELAMQRAAIVLCPSEATRQQCIEYGFAPDRVRVVPWAVRSAPVPESAVQRAKVNHGLLSPYLLFCGTIEPRKNLPRLLAAFAELEHRDIDLVLAGPTGWNEELDTAIAALGRRVHRLGYVPRGELDALIAGATAAVYPSLWEGFGLPVLEAMAQGVPVVTSRGTATEEVAGDAAVLVDPHSVSSIAAGIDLVLGDASVAARLRSAGPARAARFSWSECARVHVSAYEDAAG